MRNEDAVPLEGFKSRQRVGDRRDVRQAGKAALAGVSNRFHLAGFDQADHRRAVGKEEFHLTRHDVGERQTAAAIGHVIDLDAGHVPEHFETEMLQRAVAGRRHVDPIGRGFGKGDDVGDCLHRHRRGHHQDVRHQRNEEDRVEILLVVERQMRIERAVHRERGGVMQNGVAVGRGPGDHLFANGAAGAATVFDGELLTEILAQLGVKDARRGVGAAGRRIRHDDPHRPIRPRGLRFRSADKWRGRHPGQHHASCEIGPGHRAPRSAWPTF